MMYLRNNTTENIVLAAVCNIFILLINPVLHFDLGEGGKKKKKKKNPSCSVLLAIKYALHAEYTKYLHKPQNILIDPPHLIHSPSAAVH